MKKITIDEMQILTGKNRAWLIRHKIPIREIGIDDVVAIKDLDGKIFRKGNGRVGKKILVGLTQESATKLESIPIGNSTFAELAIEFSLSFFNAKKMTGKKVGLLAMIIGVKKDDLIKNLKKILAEIESLPNW